MATLPSFGRGARFILTLTTFGLATAGVGCGGAQTKGPNELRPLDERRAVQVIINAFRDESADPVPGRKVEIQEKVFIELDVGARGRKFGVAYTTPNERTALGAAIPQRDAAMGDSLILVNGMGDDHGAKVLVLHDIDYRYDDHVGSDHEETAITAENKLARDVRDFVVRARVEKWQ